MLPQLVNLASSTTYGTAVIDWFLERKNELPGFLVVVPTAQSSRRLRLGLAERGGLLAPKVVTTGTLMEQADTAPTAIEVLAWTETLEAVRDWGDYAAIFPESPASEGQGWALGLAKAFCDLRKGLQENGLMLASAARVLRERVADGSQHKDSGVRLTAVRVMQRFPSATSCDLLDNVLGDEHIEVRNAARTALLLYAKTNADLHKQIVENSEEAVKVNDSWQRTEQSLLIAASLTQTQFTKMCVPLLSDEFEEVNVTAAWLMHLYPDPFVMEEVTAIADERYKLLSGPGGGGAVGLQLAHLIQLAGFLEHKPIQPLCEKQFSKGSILGREGRSAAMWTLGMLHREKPEPELTTKLLGRLNDRHSMMPELDLVRRMALMSVGRMMVKSEVEHVRTAYKDDPPGTLIPESARWVLKRFGETDIPPMRIQADSEQRVGGWKIFPLADREE